MLGCCSAMILLWRASAEMILLASGETSREKVGGITKCRGDALSRLLAMEKWCCCVAGSLSSKGKAKACFVSCDRFEIED
jgi:hypothetical protein